MPEARAMSDATAKLKAARQRVRDLVSNRKAAALESHADRLEMAGTPAGRSLFESLGVGTSQLDFITAYSTLLDRFRAEPYTYAITSAYDRKFGRNFPLYQNEQELRLLRAPSRILCQTNTYAQALVEGLESYVIGPGYAFRVMARDKCSPPAPLVDAIQSVVDRYLRHNQFGYHDTSWADLEQLPLRPIQGEAFSRSLRDGDVTLLHAWDDDLGVTEARFVESEYVVQPPGGRWEEWSFGIKTPPNDEQRKLAFWISLTGNAVDGNEYPVNRLCYLARNTDRILKRGVPDFAFDAADALQVAQRLRRHLAVGGAIKAGIVGVRQHKAQTQATTQSFADQLADQQRVDLVTGNVQNVRRYQPGEFEDIDENLEYVRGPSTDCEAALVEVLGACLRGAVVRWNGFEWLVSADASPNTYDNALAAQSPAVKRVEREQAAYKAFFLRSVAIAVRDCADRGLIRAAGRTWEWEQICALVEVQCEAPSAEVQQRDKESQVDQTLNMMGAKSVQTICQEQGLDYEREMTNIEEHVDRFGQPGMGLGVDDEEPGPGAKKKPGTMIPGFERPTLSSPLQESLASLEMSVRALALRPLAEGSEGRIAALTAQVDELRAALTAAKPLPGGPGAQPPTVNVPVTVQVPMPTVEHQQVSYNEDGSINDVTKTFEFPPPPQVDPALGGLVDKVRELQLAVEGVAQGRQPLVVNVAPTIALGRLKESKDAEGHEHKGKGPGGGQFTGTGGSGETQKVKYPRTPHLPWTNGATSDDRILKDTEHFVGKHVVVTEKLDGENTTMYHDAIHARSLDTGNHASRSWVKQLHASIKNDIPPGWRVCGENVYATHAIGYEKLPSYFFVFGIYDEKGEALSWNDTKEYSKMLGLETVPTLYDGVWDEDAIKQVHTGKSSFGNTAEGYVVRTAGSFPADEFSENVAKFVRSGHVGNDEEHWKNRKIVRNELVQPPVKESKDDSGHEHKGKGEGGGQFTGTGGGGAAAGKEHHPGAAHGSQVKVSLTDTRAAPRNAKGGIDPVPVKTQLSKQETGRVAEAAIRSYLRDIVGIKDTVGLNAGKPNESIDLFGDSMAPEVKGGGCWIGKGAQQWRITFSMELGKTEQAKYDAMSADQQAAWREKRQRACLKRKVELLKKLSKERGKEIKAVTFTGIVNPDTRTVDIYKTEGYHQRVGWHEPKAKYAGSVRYEHAD